LKGARLRILLVIPARSHRLGDLHLTVPLPMRAANSYGEPVITSPNASPMCSLFTCSDERPMNPQRCGFDGVGERSALARAPIDQSVDVV